jgi:ABC-type lipoprotein release transport system permease subunit
MVPVSYNCRNLVVRWKATVMTAAAFTLVVAAVVVMLAFARGVERVCATSGEPENVVVLAKGSHDEVLSSLTKEMITRAEGVAAGAAGQPLASRELFLVVQHQDEATGRYGFLQVRGVHPDAFAVHTRVRVVEGEPFRRNQRELIVGRSLQRELRLRPGDTLAVGRERWKVTGVFEADGAAFESEAWGDRDMVAGQFRRGGLFTSVVLRAADAAGAEAMARRLEEGRSNVEAATEPQYYAQQAEQTKDLKRAAWTVAWFMGIGAVFGVMNTMFAAIGARVKDIAVMRLMGFRARDILLSFLTEAFLIALLGGALGLALGSAANGITRSTAVGARQVEFSLHVDRGIVTAVAAFTALMGLLGGILPALHAMRVKPLEALK